MKGKSGKRILLKRVLPAVLAASMIVGIVEWKNLKFTRVNAATSLPGIENIISRLTGVSGNYRMLEIVPDGDEGIFGYYVSGQEPVDFKKTLGEKTSIAARTDWANKYLKKLYDKGIMSSNDRTPITATYSGTDDSFYKEYYPWEKTSSDDCNTISLGRTETLKVNGRPVAKDGGNFTVAASSFNYQEGGDYVQKVDFTNPIDSLSEFFNSDEDFKNLKDNYVFYKPVFVSVSAADVEDQIDRGNDASLFHFSGVSDKVPVYTLDSEVSPNEYIFDLAGSDDHEFKIGEKYYAIEKMENVIPGSLMDDSYTLTKLKRDGWLASRVDSTDGFTKADSGRGYFNLKFASLKYVGSGNGSFDLENAEVNESGALTIEYDEIRYEGGYTNNNWFLRYILDCDGITDLDSLSRKITVDCRTASDAPTDLSEYGLVVISHGLDESSEVKLKDEVKTALVNYATNKGALLLDISAIQDNKFLSETGVSAASDEANNPDGIVSKSVFAFRGVKGKRERVTTGELTTDYPENEYETEGSSFYEVSKSILDENFLRRQKNRKTTDLLSEKVSMASCIRYIISYNVSSVRNSKKQVRILDIEPGDSSEITTDGKLNENLRKQWFGSSFSEDAVKVTTMSTRELVGKTEDISENYDLVYVGGGTDKDPVYNDTDMNGLVYYNIGDTVVLDQDTPVANIENTDNRAVTAGMYTKDFTIKNKVNNYDGKGNHYTQTNRNSGNDITEKKKKELSAFIKSGHPVIVSDNLMTAGNISDTDSEMTIGLNNITVSTGNGAVLNANPSYNGKYKDLVRYTYQWYCRQYGNWEKISGAVSSSYKVPENHYDNNYEYYCRITSVTVGNQTTELTEADQPSSGAIDLKFKEAQIVSNGGSGFQWSKDDDANKQWIKTTQHVTIDRMAGTLTPDGNNNSHPGDSWVSGDDYVIVWSEVNRYNTDNNNIYGKDVYFYNNIKKDTDKEETTTNISEWDEGDTIQAKAYFSYSSSNPKDHGWVRLFTDKYTITSKAKDESKQMGLQDGCKASAVVSLTPGKYHRMSSKRVDHYTQLYSLFTDNAQADNIWTSKEATDVSIVRYVNISTPEIVPVDYTETDSKTGYTVQKTGFPAEYNENLDSSQYLGDTLTLNFKIVNTTDPSPKTTTYSAEVYFDKDGNGLFNEEEMAQDIFVAGKDGTDGINYVSSMHGVLSEDDNSTTYTLSVTLPEDMTGAVNWKLVITQNPDDGSTSSEYMPHTSVNRISYKAGNKQTINVLQINSGFSDRKAYNLEMELDQDPDGTKELGTSIPEYGKWLNDENIIKSKYDINIITINTDDFNKMKYQDPNRSTKTLTNNDGNEYPIVKDGDITLDAYNMIILGFADSYGYLNRDSCYRIQEFADSGKSVLFTHDNSSHAYIPSHMENDKVSDDDLFKYYNYSPSGSGEYNLYMWGAFNFNTILRSVDKMDVYGITDTVNGFGGTRGWKQKAKDGKTDIGDGLLARQDPDSVLSDISSDDIENLKSHNYSIAYKPVSTDDYDPNEVQTVPQTQGYTDGFLYRFHGDKDGNKVTYKDRNEDMLTTKVKQVNTGTITTYPYYLNNKTDQKLNIAPTHVQYSQLNMNSDNIVVWYTLSDDKDDRNYKYSEQDCINNYYIFSCDNIFYTGAGHTLGAAEDEVKLFINTMIAAYRQQDTKPKAYFTGSAKSTKQVSSYLVSTGAKALNAVDTLRSYIEDFTGIDTSAWDDEHFMNLKPCGQELGMTKDQVDIAAKAATVRIAYAMENPTSGQQIATDAQARADKLTYGPAVGDTGGKEINYYSDIQVRYLTENSTIGQICLGINRILLNKNVDTNDGVIPGLVMDSGLSDQKYYFTIRDNNNSSSKEITTRFYLYSRKAVEGIDTEKYKLTHNETDSDKGYFYDITDSVLIYEPEGSASVSGKDATYSSNKVYSLKLDTGNPALTQLSKDGTVTLAIAPTVKINSKTLKGDISKVVINTAGLLALG